MPREITAEQRREWAAKGAATLRAHKEAERERLRQREAEREAQIAALRRVRDNPEADPADVLRAVELLDRLTPKY